MHLPQKADAVYRQRAELAQGLVVQQVAVLGLQTFQLLFQRLRQRVIGRVLVGKQGVTTFAGQFLRMQQAAQARIFLVRKV